MKNVKGMNTVTKSIMIALNLWTIVWMIIQTCFVLSSPERILTDFQNGFIFGSAIVTALGLIACIVCRMLWGKTKCPTNRENVAETMLALATIMSLAMLLETIYGYVMELIFGVDVATKDFFAMLQILIPFHIITFAIGTFHMKGIEKVTPEKHSMKFWQFPLCIIMSFGILGVGNVIGTVLNMILTFPFGGAPVAITEIMQSSNTWLTLLAVGIGAPVVEEMIFRKFLLDRVGRYGEGMAILTSGLLFGLFHGNVQQFFFAFGLGAFFAFIYLRTGKIWYTIGLHMVINMSSAAIALPLIKNLNWDLINAMETVDPASAEAVEIATQLLSDPIIIAFAAYVVCLLGLYAAGAICLIIAFCFKKFRLKPAQDKITEGQAGAFFGNAGAIIAVVFCLSLFVTQFIYQIIG